MPASDAERARPAPKDACAAAKKEVSTGTN
jgi:hypothetical protein